MTRWLLPEELGHYEPVSRSMRIEGYSTSVRLERVFWDVLDEIAESRRMTTGGLVAEIYREMHGAGDPLSNFSSVLRVICLRHLECGAGNVPLAHQAPAPFRGRSRPRDDSNGRGIRGETPGDRRAEEPMLPAYWGIGPLR